MSRRARPRVAGTLLARYAVTLPLVVAVVLGGVSGCFSRPLPTESIPIPTRPTPAPAPAVDTVEAIPTDAPPPGPSIGVGPPVRVALRVALDTAALTATGPWRLLDARGGVLVRSRANERWHLERRAARTRAVREDGAATPWTNGTVYQFPDDAGTVRSAGKNYRGAIGFVATDTGILVVNHLPLEDYLRGVVPLEIGDRGPGERAAVEAQAVAARSFTVIRLLNSKSGVGRSPDFDLISSVGDQVYGGQSAERPVADEAVRVTSGLVLMMGGRVVNAPFFSACGGETAAAEEVWRTDGEPHLRRVSDKIPGTDRHYCDIAPRFAWTRSFSGAELDAAVRKYLASVAEVGRSGPGQVTDLHIERRTPSGRVGQLIVRTSRGSYIVRGNDARSVLRTPSGELLNSSYFSVSIERSGDKLMRAVLRGNGYGHGVGMCQWGAIGRARAGQDLRSILRTYYPGTTLTQLPPSLLSQ
ncbi:MAG: SpoIID/LytB domain-containing protein [Gemmatimonadaceae bacterium]